MHLCNYGAVLYYLNGYLRVLLVVHILKFTYSLSMYVLTMVTMSALKTLECSFQAYSHSEVRARLKRLKASANQNAGSSCS
jgi:hypothetical protein